MKFRALHLVASAVFGTAGILLLAAEPAEAASYCDYSTSYACSCVQSGANAVCFAFYNPQTYHGCNSSPPYPCSNPGNIKCPSATGGTTGAGTCLYGYVSTGGACGPFNFATC